MTTTSAFAPCPCCSAEFTPYDGPTHRYIESHPGCWALYSEFLALGTADETLLRNSRVPHTPPTATDADPELAQLLVDAYAAQHHGVPSPQATQSVAVHLLVLHGGIRRGMGSGRALWIRTRALRVRGVYHWLTPPDRRASLALRHLWPSDSVGLGVPVEAYVLSVYKAWAAEHEEQLARWFDRFVLDDAAHRSLEH